MPNTACDGGTPDGELTVAVTNDDGSTYSYQWYLGTGTGTALAEGVNPTGPNESDPTNVTSDNVSGLFEDTYTVVVTVTTSNGTLSEGCTATAEFTLTHDPTTITYDSGVATNIGISECTGTATGSFDLNGSEREDGADVGGTYTYAFYDDGGTEITTGVPAGVTVAGDNISGLAAGSYYVVITNTDTNCESGNLSFDILDGTILPQLSIAVTANNTDCNTGPATPNGILTVTVDNAGSLGGNYNYTWYNGADVNDEGSPTGDAAAGTAATSHATTSGLAAGDYWVKVEDVDAATCIAKISDTIINDQAEISVDEFTAVASTECTPGNGTV
ncbi:MAG: hypothetical protein JXQ96_20050, partial [Cyclobacteriaceae bacterium]